ncbi:bursicon-like [Tetranychus urticae]|uniref:Bursicon n=1 Tax=Tetranychus urticae TaxID=32264 RepID=T1JVR8_TETUR|nr:bursicon-like [Tetranychus urticae]
MDLIQVYNFLISIIVVSILIPVLDGSKGCHLRPVIHVLSHPGCLSKPIPSFACHGSCSSYVQVSGSKFWQVERSCMCCQEMGEREATVGIFCPKKTPKFRKIATKAPVDCMCRPCTGIDDLTIKPQELINLTEELRKTDQDGSS